jgi:hypothetical protein
MPGLEVIASGPIYPLSLAVEKSENIRQSYFNARRATGYSTPAPSGGRKGYPSHWPHPARTYAGGSASNAHVQSITKNVLDRMLKDSPRRA